MQNQISYIKPQRKILNIFKNYKFEYPTLVQHTHSLHLYYPSLYLFKDFFYWLCYCFYILEIVPDNRYFLVTIVGKILKKDFTYIYLFILNSLNICIYVCKNIQICINAHVYFVNTHIYIYEYMSKGMNRYTRMHI